MGVEYVAYPFLFLAIFFESFVLITLLSAKRQGIKTGEDRSVAVIVPCFNKGDTLGATVESLLALSYPKDKLSVILVNDGSTDTTKEVIEGFRGNPQVTIIHQKNGGKHAALNAGIAVTSAEFIGCIDADSFVAPDALNYIMAGFHQSEVAAVTAAMSIHEPKNFLEKMQHIEYLLGITLRQGLSVVNGLYVTPGPFSFYRKEVVQKLGGFRHAHQVEDMEMALRLQKAGYRIENAILARVTTTCPSTFKGLIKQRTRWTSGFLRNIIGEYRGLVGNRHYGALGLLVLPLATLAIVSGVVLFIMSMADLVVHGVSFYQVHQGVPFSYFFTPHFVLDWFYLPATNILLLSSVTIIVTIVLVIIGKRSSRAQGKISLGIVIFLILYRFIVPLWYLRSMTDVVFGKRRQWE